jgi:hypothetical protein
MENKPPDTIDDEELKVIRDAKRGGKTLWIFVAVTLIIIGIIVYLIFLQRPSSHDRFVEKSRISDPDRRSTTPDEGEPESAMETLPEEESAYPAPPDALEESDGYLREQLEEYLDQPSVLLFFAQQGVVRRFVAVTSNIAGGESPGPLLDFIPFSEPFSIITERGRIRVSERSFARYDDLVDTFITPDPRKIVDLYLATEHLFNRAYRDLGQSGQSFRPILLKALNEILEVPVIFDKIYLDRGVLSYEYVREDLQVLTDAQKHFLRLGPLNLRRVQKQVREIRDLLNNLNPDKPGNS